MSKPIETGVRAAAQSFAWRRIALALWRISIVVMLFLWLHPVSYRSTRLATMALLFAVWTGSLVFWWRVKWVRVTGIGAVVFLLLIAVLPGRSTDSGKLRQAYIEALQRYEGTRYVWGGENKMGIDCSGLVRRGLIDGLLRHGMATANAELIRQSLLMRWFDCSALALQEGYRGQTHRLLSAKSIARLDHNQLLPGDFAVTADGIHTLAYLGDKVWIEADPGAHRVIRIQANEENGWLAVPVDVMRWRILEAKSLGE